MTFKDLKLNNSILKVIEKENYINPTLVQEQAIPYILDNKDILATAQTGTGKTAAFVLPIIDKLLGNKEFSKKPKILVLTPTRELAMQIKETFRKFTIGMNIRCTVIFGGVNQKPQVEQLKKGVEVIVATPGRLLDLINQRYVKLDEIKVLVLDEADMMLDMGFITDVNKIVTHISKERQTLLFSATISKEIQELSKELLINPITIKTNSNSLTVDNIKQQLYYIDKSNKTKLLIDILNNEDVKTALVFTRTKNGANKLFEQLINSKISCDVIHGNKSQAARMFALNSFKTGKSKVLIATDIAARGIDISELSHVINYEIPEKTETYVHRIGRTARAGFSGIAISLCTLDEKKRIVDIQNFIKQNIPVVSEHDYPMQQIKLTPKTRDNYKSKEKRFVSNNKYNSSQNTNKSNNKPFGSNNKNFKRTFNKNYSSNRGR